MLSVLLILPDFLVILLGFLLMQYFREGVFNATFWKGAEKIVFYVLFPPLLFTSVATSNLTLGEAGLYLVVAISAMMCAVVMSYLIRFIVKADPVTSNCPGNFINRLVLTDNMAFQGSSQILEL